jgi:uncharacterized RDD family membrane protein YckC
MTATATTQSTTAYAGFWCRLIAYLINYTIVGLAMFALFSVLSLAVPGLNRIVTPELPFDMLTTDKTLEEKPAASTDGDATTIVSERIVERTVLGIWTHLYRVTEKKRVNADDTSTSSTSTTTTWQHIDPETKQDIDATDLGTLAFFAAFLYFAWMESSARQATFGKMATGAKVTDRHGARLSFPRALMRNVAKVLSMITLGIGFLMAGWTRQKQALHDMVGETLVESTW